MTSALVSFTFNNTKLFTITINDKPWTRAKEVCRSLNYTKKTPDVIVDPVSLENRAYKYQLTDLPRNGEVNGLNGQLIVEKMNITLMSKVCMNWHLPANKKKAKEFRKYCCNTLFPQIRQKLVDIDLESSNRRHQLAIEDMGREHQQAIEAKDTALAMLNDDLDESQREYTILEYRYEQLETRAVPYLEDPKKDNSMVVIQKNNGDEYPYIAICGQQGYVAQKIQNKLIDFPNGQIVVLAETPNAICHYNWLRERGCIEVNPDRVRHFRLGRNLTHQDLLGIQDI